MKEIKDILADRFKSVLNEYKWYYIIWKTSKFWRMDVQYNIFNSDFRMIYQWKFHNISSACVFIDKNDHILKSVSN
jgi:hypothetical protein